MEIRIDQLQNQFGFYFNVSITVLGRKQTYNRQFFAYDDLRKWLAVMLDDVYYEQ